MMTPLSLSNKNTKNAQFRLKNAGILVILSRLIARNCMIHSGEASWSWSELQCGLSPLSDWLPPVACRIKSAAERRGGR